MEATADQAIAKLKELFVKAIYTVAAAKDRIKGKDNEKISETAWWFPMFASSTCTSLASCLGLSDDNLKVLTDTAGRYWFRTIQMANIHISKMEHNKEVYYMLGPEEESIVSSIKQQISGKVSKPSWVQNIPSVRADQPPLFKIEEEEECPQILPTKRRKIEKLNKCDGEWYPLKRDVRHGMTN